MITEQQLNYIITCSFEKAPLDSYALLVREPEGGYQWKPASAIQRLKSSDRIDCAWIYFNVGFHNLGIFCLNELDRDELSDDAWNRTANWNDVIQFDIAIVFTSGHQGDLDHERPGKWVKESGGNGNLCYRAILYMPIAGEVLRRRLEKHADFLKEGIQQLRARSDKDASRQLAEYEETLHSLEKAKKLIPDDSPHHIYCKCCPAQDSVIRLDEESAEAKVGSRTVKRVPSALRGIEAGIARKKLLAKNRDRRHP